MARKRTSRSEQVRARRAKATRAEPTVPRPAQTAREHRTAHNAPFLMRGAKVDVPLNSPKGARLRRRYDISLGSPGAEMQLPAVPVVRVGWRWLSGLLAIGLVTLLVAMWNHPAFLVSAVTVQGLQRLEAREVALVLNVQDAPIFSLDPAVMAHDLALAFPEFKTVQVAVGLPSQVEVIVEERQPVLAWLNAQGMVLVDEEGISFPARGLVVEGVQALHLPVVHAPDLVMAAMDGEGSETALNPYVGRKLLRSGQVTALVAMSQSAPPGARLLFDPAHGMGWEDPAGWVVYFGSQGSDMPARLQMYTSIVEDLQRKGITPALISVEYIHAPYYRMER